MADEKSGTGGRRGKRGHSGKRGHRGHRGHAGADGSAGAAGATGPSGTPFPSIIAAAVVDSGALFLSETGFSGIAHPSVGQFVLTLTTPVSGDDIGNIVVAATLGGPSGPVVGQISFLVGGPTISIFTTSSTGVATDTGFSLVVYDLTL